VPERFGLDETDEEMSVLRCQCKCLLANRL
jgi:hypothetical protein